MSSIRSALAVASVLLASPAFSSGETPPLPPMPEPVTSFGAAIAGGALYFYGGNSGKAHEYNRECVKGDFFRLPMPDGTAWEKLEGGPPLLSCALVSDGGMLIRIGGLSARNDRGAPNDLHSTDEVMVYDPGAARWQATAKLPVPRSSHDAAILDHVIYVGGGWDFSESAGADTKPRWSDVLLTLDLRAAAEGWKSRPQPFQRRSLAVVAQGGRIWFIGGLERDGELSRLVDWFDPAAGQWGKGPELPDDTMGGFGVAACEQQGKLFVSPYSGKILTLSGDGAQWIEIGKLTTPRFFHRLLPLLDGRLIAVGGSNQKGHVAQLEVYSPAAKWEKREAGAAWPQWRGPNRDGVSSETGWRKDWPAAGPPKLWTAEVGVGMSSPVVADGRLITQGNDGNGMDTIVALDGGTGKERWHFAFPCRTAAHEMPIVPNGPASTPTIVGGRVFCITREGDLICLETDGGKPIWRKNLVSDLGGKRPVYGYAQSPLVVDGIIYLDVGAEPGASGSTIALDAVTGNVKWKAGTGEAGYSSARFFDRDGKRFVAMFKGQALDVFNPADGHVMWSYRITGADFTNALTPVFVDHRILVSNTSEAFARLLDWDDSDAPNVRVAWKNQQFALLFNNPIVLDGVLYAFNEKRRDPPAFTALDAQTGETRWTSDAVPTGTFILADKHWIFLTRSGEVLLAPASAEELKPTARFQALEGKCYATPALAGGRLYVRSNAGELAAFDLK
jgi:outer membrane protein assembly factor BamB